MVLREIGRRPAPQDTRNIPSTETGQDNEKRSLSARLVELLPELIKEKGSVGLGLLEELAAGRISVQEFSQELEEAPDFEHFQELGLQFLEDNGLVERTKEGETIVDIMSLKRLKEPSALFFNPGVIAKRGQTEWQALWKAKKQGYVAEGLSEIFAEPHNFEDWYSAEFDGEKSANFITFLTNVFMGKEVVSKEEWNNWKKKGSKSQQKPQAKPLLYTPESSEAAFDPEQIRASEFHIGPWSLPGRKSAEFSSFLPGASFDEVSLAALIYHPRYGDGQRDEKGHLIVTFKEGKRRKISQEWIRQNNFSTYRPAENTFQKLVLGSPQKYLSEGNLSNLQEKGLLKQADFSVLQESEVGQKYGLERRITDRVGLVLLNDKIRYTLGSEFADGKHAVVYLEPGKLAGIVRIEETGEKTLTHTFNLFSREELLAKDKKTDPKSKMITVGKKEIEIIPYYEGEQQIFSDRKSDETEEAYTERVQSYTASELLGIKNEISRETGINLGQLTLREQGSFVEFYQGITEQAKNKAREFVKKYKLEGLRILSSLDSKSETGRLIFELDVRLRDCRGSIDP